MPTGARMNTLARPAPPPWPRGRPSPARGSRQPWAGLWGPLADGRSRLSRLVRRIESDELGDYPAGPVRRRAAMLYAIAEMTLAGVGSDPKATPRRVTALVGAAERHL